MADLSPPQGNALGEVWLQDTVPPVAGSCTDQDGKPLPGVALAVQARAPEGEAAVWRPFGSDNWYDLSQPATVTGADGTFAIHGPPQFGTPLRLRARGRPGVLVQFQQGATDMEFVLPQRRPWGW